MLTSENQQALKKDLLIHWLVFGALLTSLGVYLVIGYNFAAMLRGPVMSEEPVVIKSIFYALAIITFPMINLLRHVTLRLNQTMPTATPAKLRYLVSVIISLALAETIGIYGLVLALLGDSINSLWIFTLLALLAMILYRPKFNEYLSIVTALANQPRQQPNVR